MKKARRELEKWAKDNNIPLTIRNGSKHQHLIIDGKTVAVVNLNTSIYTSLKNIKAKLAKL